jgi:hypothetical protein
MNIERRKVEIRLQRKIKDVFLNDFTVDLLTETIINERAVEIISTELKNLICQSKEEEE